MVTVAVTGCSGYLGRKVCELLEHDDSVGRVVGIDVREPGFGTRNLEFYRLDVRSSDLAGVIDGCETVVHLAAVNDRDPTETRDVIVGGIRCVTRAAAQTGVRKLIFTSASDVYGSHPDNPKALTEDAVVRPGPRGYGAANAEAEEIARTFAFEQRDAVVTILRLAPVSGPSLPPVPLVLPPDQGFQAIHEDDAVRAVGHFLGADLPGTFNIAAEDGSGEIVVSTERLRASGFVPEHSSADAIRQGAEAQRGWVSVGGMRLKPAWVAAAAGSVAALALSASARARRARRAKA